MPTLIYDNWKMRIISISDTHGLHEDLDIPDGDVLVHAGDMTSHGRLAQIKGLNEWFGSFPHKYKIVISGNHDWGFQNQSKQAKDLMTSCLYLQNESVEIEGLNFMALLGSRMFIIGPLTYLEVKN